MDVNHVLILLEEILEKVWRLETFLNEIELICVEQDRKLIQFYRSQIDGLKKKFFQNPDPIAEILSHNVDPEKVEDILETYFLACSNFQTMHHQFQFFVSLPKICQEVYTFIYNLFPGSKFETVEPTLIYYPIYNFQ